MDNEKTNKKIIEAKRKIKEEKKKIKIERRLIRKRKRERFKKTKFGKTKVGRFLAKVFFVFSDKNTFNFQELFTTTIISLIMGFFTCLSIITIISGGKNVFKLSRELSKFYDVYEVLVDNYKDNLDKEKLIDEAIDGMVSSVGDTYTKYSDIESAESFKQMVSGTYKGIGCTIKKVETGIEIVGIYKDSPAEKAGLKEKDIIIKVDNKDATKEDATSISNYIKNEAKGKIKITALRNEEAREFTLEKSNIELPTIDSEVFEKNDKKIGYIYISIFSSVTEKQFEEKLLELEKKKIDGLVIDVRDNSGGYLNCVSDIASLLLPKGNIIYQTEKDNKKVITKDKTTDKRTYPIAILTNGNSASASEILAAAIKESYGGLVIGTKTFGKGTVQQTKKLSDGSMVKYTVENWLTPDGNWIDGVGIEPTEEVKLAEEYYKNPSHETDNQLQKALDLVSK